MIPQWPVAAWEIRIAADERQPERLVIPPFGQGDGVRISDYPILDVLRKPSPRKRGSVIEMWGNDAGNV